MHALMEMEVLLLRAADYAAHGVSTHVFFRIQSETGADRISRTYNKKKKSCSASMWHPVRRDHYSINFVLRLCGDAQCPFSRLLIYDFGDFGECSTRSAAAATRL